MNLTPFYALPLSILALLCVPSMRAQPSPRVGYAYPAGGQRGSTFLVILGGQRLDGATNVYFSGRGIQGKIVEYFKPLNQLQIDRLRTKLRELQDKRSNSVSNPSPSAGQNIAATNRMETAEEKAADETTIADLRRQLANTQKGRANPVLAETVQLEVAIAPEAELGERELRLDTALGLSNPLAFQVGPWPEYREREPKGAGKSDALDINCPACVNGQILPGEVDRFRFKARQGEELIAVAAARNLIPYLPDAVPGWFQASLSLYDAKGMELAFADHYLFHPDPVLHYTIPRDGEYTITIRDSLYRGREDFVYRLTVGALPLVTDIFPLGGRVGAPTKFDLRGYNLPAAQVTRKAKERETDIYPWRINETNGLPDFALVALDSLPECLEQEPNNMPETAQAVVLPIVVNGRVDQPGDADLFRFTGRKDEKIVAEVLARRLNSPLDSKLALLDAKGRQLAFNDDHEDKGSGLQTHHADSWLSATLPSDGTYCVKLGDAQNLGGPAYGYRLRVGPPRPDFALRVVPSSINVRAGASIPIEVYALRKDGFAGQITLALRDAPKGYALSGAWIPPKQDRIRITLSAPSDAPIEPVSLRMEGRATIGEKEVVRPGVPAEDMTQAFSYRHLVPAQDLMVAARGRRTPGLEARMVGEIPVRIPAGGTAKVRFTTPPRFATRQSQFDLDDPPKGIAIQSARAVADGVEMVLQCDAATVTPGLQGNLIIEAVARSNNASAKARPTGANRRPGLGCLPAIPFTVVPRVTIKR